MLKVVSAQKADEIIEKAFSDICPACEKVKIEKLCTRILGEDIVSGENVPAFDRVTVDGYAVLSGDTFGCSESMPCQLEVTGEILMGQEATDSIASGRCIKISTGGMLPEGADGAVMVENTEEMVDGTCLIYKAVSPFENVTKKGDDVKIGDKVLKKGTRLSSKHIGVLASLGISEALCIKKLKVGIISSGDEIVPVEENPACGQVRDVNSHILSALCRERDCEVKAYGIIRDSFEKLYAVTEKAVSECDIVLLSGGSSAGTRDMTVKVISDLGEVFVHGIAVKPGKPTIIGKIGNCAVFGLPGHPAAAYFTAMRFVLPLIKRIYGADGEVKTVKAVTAFNISSNHGREEFIPVRIEKGVAYPIFRKSGVISLLCEADGYIVIDRNKEGLKTQEEVEVHLF